MAPSPVQLWDPVGTPHRRIARAGTKARKGRDIRNFQGWVDKWLHAHPGMRMRQLVKDGIGDRDTIAIGRDVCFLIGVDPGGKVDYGISVYAQRRLRDLVTGKDSRTPGEKARALRAQERRREELHPEPRVEGNRVVGGRDFADRKVAALDAAVLNCARGVKRRFYSQAGRFVLGKAIVGEDPGERSDCSQFERSIQQSAGRSDPASGYFTGTAKVEGEPCALEDLIVGRGYVVYGGGNGHHMEAYRGNGVGGMTYAQVARKHGTAVARITVGHGSAPVDRGDVFMMADPHFYNLPERLTD